MLEWPFYYQNHAMSDKQAGIVKEFSEEKRFGTLVSNGKEYFVHFSALGKKVQTLNKGETVRFTAGNGPKKLHAEDVELLES